MMSIFEEMGGTYTLRADGMYYPDLELPEEEPHCGKYGRMRLRYLKRTPQGAVQHTSAGWKAGETSE